MYSTLLAACGSDESMETPTQAGTAAVVFDAVLQKDEPTTRANGEINEAVPTNATDDDELSNHGGFGVFGCYTGLHKYVDSNVSPDFMYNEHVQHDGAGWYYTPVKYWPNGEGEVEVPGNTGTNHHYVSFMAYAPYSNLDDSDPATNPAGYCISTFSLQSEVGNPWLTYHLIPQANLDKQVDLLFASHTTTGVDPHPLLDCTKQSTDGKVKFVFEHALACVGDKVTFSCSETMRDVLKAREGYAKVDVEVTECSIEYTLAEKGRLVLWNNGEANWQQIVSEDPTCTRRVTIVTKDDPKVIYSYEPDAAPPAPKETVSQWVETGKGVFYIPLDAYRNVQSAHVTMTYKVRYYRDLGGASTAESAVTGTAGLKLSSPDYPNGYKPGKHLYLNIAVDMVTIQITGAIKDWDDSEPAKGKVGEEVEN